MVGEIFKIKWKGILAMRGWQYFRFLIVTVFVCMIFAGCNNAEVRPKEEVLGTDHEDENSIAEQEISALNAELEMVKDEMEDLQERNEQLQEEKEYHVQVIKNLFTYLSDEEMLEFAREQIVYKLTVNGEPIPENGKLTIASGDVEILLSQRFDGAEFLEAEWIEKGKISGEYIDHIRDFDTTNWEEVGYDGTVVTARGYRSLDVKTGTMITFQITDELKERLNMTTNQIQIEVE